jgi:hypothetical protein
MRHVDGSVESGLPSVSDGGYLGLSGEKKGMSVRLFAGKQWVGEKGHQQEDQYRAVDVP